MHNFFLIASLFLATVVYGQQAGTSNALSEPEKDVLQRYYLTPQHIVWKSSDSLVVTPEALLDKGTSQAYFGRQKVCRLINKGGKLSGLILDFGREIHGGVQITTSQSNTITRKVRLRFGESVSETCAEAMNIPISKDGSTNHHSIRDFDITLPGYGTLEVGSTGFRFLRIDLLDPDVFLVLKEVRAIAVQRDLPYIGSFKCNDERLNQIWRTGAYTTHLCMQTYLVDGIKRDRMVWGGDMHPELMTINSVFGYNEIVPKSLDFLRDNYPLPKYLNGIASYSLWWIIMQHDWYQQHGRLNYLKQQQTYLVSLLDQLTREVDQDGVEQLDPKGMRFLNWPSFHNKPAVHAGLQAMMVMAFEKGARLCTILGQSAKAKTYTDLAAKMRKHVPDVNGSKEAASLLALTGQMDAGKADQDVIAIGGADKFSAFFGYYMLQAQAKAGDYTGALNNIRRFWGGMLDMGATTFWEEFEPELAKGAGRIDEFIPNRNKDYHKDTGVECYIGLRRSLCHGWASGPTPWLSEHILGIKVLEPGCKKIKLEPQLGDLQWAEGNYPTPQGVLYVKHTKLPNGKINTVYKAPQGVVVVY